jgi:hypothetical protein
MAQTEIEKLLDATSGQHGFWLINHVEYIKEDLTFLLKWHRGLQCAIDHLNDLDSDFVKKLYAKIDEARGRKSEDAFTDKSSAIELSKDRFGETVTIYDWQGKARSYAERNYTERDEFYLNHSLFQATALELEKGPILIKCDHVDFRDTMDGAVCNTCGLEVVEAE